MQYLVYDVETPNQKNNSVCAVAWVLLDEQNEISRGYTLIDPKAEFSALNIRVHHITSADVSGMPTFAEYWKSTLERLMMNSVVLAHSAGFDMSVTSKALCAAGIEAPRVKYIDTMDIFRALFPADCYKLQDLAANFGFSYNAHNAMEDTNALVHVLDCLRRKKGFQNLSDMIAEARLVSCTMKDTNLERNTGSQQTRMGPYERHQARVSAMIENAQKKGVDLSEIHFCIHGILEEPHIERINGLDKIVKALGGVFHDKPSGKMDYFVCLNDSVTGAVEKARQLAQEETNHIQIIDADAFLDLIGYRTASPNLSGPVAIRERKRMEREEDERKAEEAAAQKAARVAAKEERMAAKAAKDAEPKKPVYRPVIQLDAAGNIISTFPSVTMAASSLGISTKVIRDAANGKQRTAGGFGWKYADEGIDVQKD